MGNMVGSASLVETSTSLNTLSTKPCGLNDHDVWNNIFATQLTAHDMFTVIQPELVRKLRREFPCNLAAMIFKCVEQIHGFATAEKHSKGPSPAACTNALLILTRVMPFVYERRDVDNGQVVSSDQRKGPKDFADKVLWENSLCDDKGTQFPLSGPLGKMLVQTLVRAAFVPGFTIPATQKVSPESLPNFPGVEYNMLWVNGLAANPLVPVGFTEPILANRLILVKAMLSILSEDCFQPRATTRSKLRAVLVDETLCPHAPTFVVSIMNTMISYTTAGVLPYTSHWVGNHEELTLKCSQLMCLLFDSQNKDVLIPVTKPPTSRPASATSNTERSEDPQVVGEEEADEENVVDPNQVDVEEEPTQQPANEQAPSDAPSEIEHHAAWNILSRCKLGEFDDMIIGFFRLINNHVASKSTTLPGSQRALAFIEEFVMLFFKLLTKSDNFFAFFVTNPRSSQFLIPFIDFAFEAIEDAAALSNIQIVVYMLMKLSASREFVLNANQALPPNWMPFSRHLSHGACVGTFNDLIIMSMGTLMSCRKPWLAALCEPAATVICNISAFATSIAGATCSKLTDILVHFAKPAVLQATGRPGAVILAAVVETCANMVQYQFNGCTTLVVNLLRCEKILRELHEGLKSGEIRIAPDIAKRLHLYTLICVVEALMPQLNALLARNPQADVYAYVRRTTLVGALPVPHSIIVRQFVPRPQTETWVSAWLWGCIYMHANPQFLDSRTVELFEMRAITTEQAPPPAEAGKEKQTGKAEAPVGLTSNAPIS